MTGHKGEDKRRRWRLRPSLHGAEWKGTKRREEEREERGTARAGEKEEYFHREKIQSYLYKYTVKQF